MSSLVDLRSKELQIMQRIYDNYGEVTEDEQHELDLLQTAIEDKVDAYGTVLKVHFDQELARIREEKEKLDGLAKYLKQKKEQLEARLNRISQERPLEGILFRFEPTNSICRTVNMDKVEDSYKAFVLPSLSFEEYSYLKNSVISRETAPEELLIKMLNPQMKCGVTDLPEGHPALIASIRPTVKVLKAKKKL